MGGCASKPKNLDGQNPEMQPPVNSAASEPTVKSVENDAPIEMVTDSSKIENSDKEIEEGKLVDLSEPKPEVAISERNLVAHTGADLAGEMSEPTDSGNGKEAEPSIQHDTETQSVEKGNTEQKEVENAKEVTETKEESATKEEGTEKAEQLGGGEENAKEATEMKKSGDVVEGKPQ